MGIVETGFAAATARGQIGMPVVKSAGRVIQILEFFDGVQREASVTEISRALNYPQSSTSVLLRSLVSMGYLQHDPYRRTYLPTRRVCLLGNWVDPALVQQGRLLGMVDELARQSGQTVVMATANGLNAQYIYVTRDEPLPEPLPEAVPGVVIGGLRPIATTAVGRALLSTYADEDIARLLRRFNAERPAAIDPIQPTAFLEELRRDRARGYFRGCGAEPDQAGIAMVLDRKRQLLVLGIEGDADHIDGCDERLRMLQGSTERIRSHAPPLAA